MDMDRDEVIRLRLRADGANAVADPAIAAMAKTDDDENFMLLNLV